MLALVLFIGSLDDNTVQSQLIQTFTLLAHWAPEIQWVSMIMLNIGCKLECEGMYVIQESLKSTRIKKGSH